MLLYSQVKYLADFNREYFGLAVKTTLKTGKVVENTQRGRCSEFSKCLVIISLSCLVAPSEAMIVATKTYRSISLGAHGFYRLISLIPIRSKMFVNQRNQLLNLDEPNQLR